MTPPAGAHASWGPPSPLTVLCSSPIAARGPRRRCPSSRRDPHPEPAGSGGSGSARLEAPLLLPGPSSGAGTPRAPSGEPVLPGGGALGARPGPLLLLLLLLVLPRGGAPPRGRRGPLAPVAGAPAPHAGPGGAAAPGSPRRDRRVWREAAVSPAPWPVPAAGPAAGGRWSESRGLWRRRGAHREGQPGREPAAAAPRGEAGARHLPLPLPVLHLEPPRRPSPHPFGAHLPTRTHARGHRALTHAHPEWV